MGKMTEKIIKMNYMNQSGRWPTGCESVSAVMVLNWKPHTKQWSIGVLVPR